MRLFKPTDAAALYPSRKSVQPEAPVRVLLVAVHPVRRNAWKRAIAKLELDLPFECYEAYSEAMLRSSKLGPHCLVLDSQAESVLGAAVQRFLRRCAPQAHVVWVGSAGAEQSPPSAVEMRRLLHRLIEMWRRMPGHFH
jgi:hypothetical protein